MAIKAHILNFFSHIDSCKDVSVYDKVFLYQINDIGPFKAVDVVMK